MAKFHVRNTFEITTDRKLFVIAGTVVDGQIRAGMLVRVPANSSLDMTARIHSVEFARRTDDEDVCLCIESKSPALDLWRELNLQDETLEITDEGSE